MKDGIHPTYYEDALVICSCGNTWRTGSTKKEIHTDVCYNCHPFYTGEQRKTETEARPSKKERRAQQRAAARGLTEEPEVVNPEQVAGGPVELNPVPTPADQANVAPHTESTQAAAGEVQAVRQERRNRPPRQPRPEGERGPRPPRPPRPEGERGPRPQRPPRAEQAAPQAEASQPPAENNPAPAEPATPPTSETPAE